MRWEGNTSKKCDGTVQYVESRFVVCGTVKVGATIIVKMGKSKKLWNAVVVNLLDTEDGRRLSVSPELYDDDASKQGLLRQQPD